VLEFYGAMGRYEALKQAFADWGAWIIVLKGMTPIPYKLVTIASGLAGVSFPLFMLYSTVTRSVRYLMIEAMAVHFFGEKAQVLLEKYLELALILFVVVLVLGFVALKYF
jgi:membrane protein YqaA with SNARE-associated domain